MKKTETFQPAAKKSLGQNFCIDERIPAEIVARLGASEDFTIWEIGPGKGALTEELTKTGAKLQLFEIDRRMETILNSKFPKVPIIWGDFLELSDNQLPRPDKKLLVTGNLPYYCGTPIIRRFLEHGPPACRLVFLLQQEVSLKAAARAGSRDYGFLSVHTAFFAEAVCGSTFGPESFSPPPKVRSTILEIIPMVLDENEKKRRLNALKSVSILFAQRRKMALPLLKKHFPQINWSERFLKLAIDEKARPENISPEQFLELFSPATES